MRVLITEPIDPSAEEFLRSHGYEVIVGSRGQFDTEDAIIEGLTGCDGAITMLSNPMTDRVFQSVPNLKIVANYAVGFNNIDLTAAKKHDVKVSNTPDVLSEATADIALGLLLGVSRKLVEAEQDLKKGLFDGWHPQGYVGTEIHGKTAGMIGMGRIGSAIVRRLNGFGVKTLYTNRNQVDKQIESELNVTFVADVDELLSNIDFLFLSCPLTPQTHHIIDSKRLQSLGKHVIIINTGRGPLIDEAALAKALHEGTIAGAGLDVFEREPEIHPDLLTAPKTMLLPHIGSATRETRRNMAMLAAQSVFKILSGVHPNSIKNLIA